MERLPILRDKQSPRHPRSELFRKSIPPPGVFAADKIALLPELSIPPRNGIRVCSGRGWRVRRKEHEGGWHEIPVRRGEFALGGLAARHRMATLLRAAGSAFDPCEGQGRESANHGRSGARDFLRYNDAIFGRRSLPIADPPADTRSFVRA